MLKFYSATILAAAIVVASCAQQPDIPNGIAHARMVVDKFPMALESGNLDTLSQIMVHDSSLVVFGTDSAEYWVGYPAVEQAFKAQIAAFKDIKITVSNQKVNVSESLDAAWFSEMADWSMVVNDQPLDLKGLRITGVLTNEPDGWKIVQMHVSMPVAGQAAEY